jgi:Spy/CpxP family protein refolding chaperone
MKRIMAALAVAMSMFLGTSLVYAQGAGAPEGKGMESHGRWEHGKEFSLTSEQRAKVQEMHRSFMRDNAQLIGSLVTKKIELGSLMTDPKADDKAIMDKETEVSSIKEQLKDKAFQMKLAFRKLLTPEQLANWGGGRCMGHHGAMMGHHRGMMGGHGMMEHGGMMGHHEMMQGHEM